jgi:Rrf2 family nitric oxide-sensitive transcriptional repressor
MNTVIKISDAANLGIHAMAHLAASDPDRTHAVAEIADELGVSEAHLAKVMQRLVRADLVVSRRGPGGGFVLGRPAKQINLLEIFEAIDGTLGDGGCLLGHERCLYGACLFGDLVPRMNREVRELLSKRNLSNLSKEKRRS